MTKVVELLQDVWHVGNKGDVVALTDEELDKLKKLGSDAKADGADLFKQVKVDAAGLASDAESTVDPVKKAIETAKTKDAAKATKK